MRFKKILIFAIAVLMIAMFFASCGGEEEAEKTETVTIGLSAPLSSDYGMDVEQGLEMAVEKVNADGGIMIGDTKYTFKLESADDGGVPEQALANAQRFVLEDEIDVIWNPVATTLAPLMGINTKAGEEFLIMAYTSVPMYTETYGPTPNPLMITLPPPFYVNIAPFIKLALTNDYKTMGMLQVANAYGEAWAKYMQQGWTQAGGTVVASAPADYYTVTDYTPYLTTVLAANPDVIFCGGPSEATALVIDQARGLGFEGGFMVMDQAKLDVIAEKLGMEKLEGAIGVLPVELSIWPYMQTFAPDFEAEFGRKATWESAICYTAFHIMAEAMESAGTVTDVEAIRAAFPDVSTTSGEEYPVEYSGINNETGALLMPGQVCIVQNGEFMPEPLIEWWKTE
jgi:branched-chain amino acid transport system substrate-binding protein